MNTLGHNITTTYLAPEQREALISLWKSSICSGAGSVTILLYQALLGKDWRKGYGHITNKISLENGAIFNWGFVRDMGIIRLARLDEYKPGRMGNAYAEQVMAYREARQDTALASFVDLFGGVVTRGTLERVISLIPDVVFTTRTTSTHTPEDFANGAWPMDAYTTPEAMIPIEAGVFANLGSTADTGVPAHAG